MSGGPPIQPAIQPADVFQSELLAALQHECFPEDRWTADFIATLLGQPGTFALLALVPDPATGMERPVGFALARVSWEDAEILTIGVLPAARRGGTGRRLVEAVAAEVQRRGATALFLEVAEDNDAARLLYMHSGFAPVGRRQGYYIRPNGRFAAVVMRRSFPSEP